jgi:hypothetical protein
MRNHFFARSSRSSSLGLKYSTETDFSGGKFAGVIAPLAIEASFRLPAT